MDAKKKIVMGLAAVLLFLLLVLLLLWLWRRRVQYSNDTAGDGDVPDPERAAQSVFPLGYGSGLADDLEARPYVRQVQRALNRLRGANLDEDGQWGQATESAVQRLYDDNPTLVSRAMMSQGEVDGYHYSINKEQYRSLISMAGL